ncbi:NmrA family transcriptional regulator [Amycolatopsis rhizosphaerae]|uniref:NmrA family transcriptional regulator n=1 Tax=Amycolatopsis rhizosphaerae TaxID=2053003 RepID=A0A558CI61_9PSEU|nr:NAD(P)H-binding protein [Amycolatopsis rhizosphaerae]TVT48414.1 NmrA family transcriptional regulator [Amycolatopsis rhizosphaerae]
MTILVTGARGGIGSLVVAKLAEAGHRVRGSARDPEALTLPEGAEPAGLDLATGRGAEDALRGVDRVFLYPTREGIKPFVDAAVAAGVPYVVLLSSPASYEASEYRGRIGLLHREAERTLETSGLPHTVLYPSWLATNAKRDWAAGIRAEGRVRIAFPDARFAPIHPGDVAAVAADLLTRETHRARTQVITGPESLRLRDIVAVLGEVLGRPLPVDELTREQAHEQREPWMPSATLDALLDATEAAVGPPATVTNGVERVTGHPARAFREWAREHRADFISR